MTSHRHPLSCGLDSSGPARCVGGWWCYNGSHTATTNPDRTTGVGDRVSGRLPPPGAWMGGGATMDRSHGQKGGDGWSRKTGQSSGLRNAFHAAIPWQRNDLTGMGPARNLRRNFFWRFSDRQSGFRRTANQSLFWGVVAERGPLTVSRAQEAPESDPLAPGAASDDNPRL